MADERTYSAEQYQSIKEDMLEYKQAKKELEKQLRELTETHEKTVATLTKERDTALDEAKSVREAYEAFTNENELARTVAELRGQIRERDLTDMFGGVEGVSYHEKTTLDDIIRAAGVELPGLDDEIPETFVADVLEKARANKPFLFVDAAVLQANGTESVTQEPAPREGLRAFGAQAAGGGAATSAGTKVDPVKSVDWSNPRAVDQFFAEKNAQK